MNWNELLKQASSDIPANATDCAFTPLASAGLIRVRGEDARSFLQGQLTNDIESVSADQAQLSAWCTPKGRILALFLLFEHSGDLHLQLPRERMDAVLKRLRMFILRARVSLDDVSDSLAVAGAWGECLTERLERIPGKNFGTLSRDGLTLIRFPGKTPRVQIVGDRNALADFWQKMEDEGSLASEEGWDLQNIRAGVPGVVDATAEAFIPQMLNLDVLNGISFTKGCYTGQEVVARMKYLGQLKRRMYLARLEDDSPLSAGDGIWSPESTSAQGAGKVVMAAASENGGREALVVAEIAVADTDKLRLGGEDGPGIRLSPPPYEVPELKD
jgi:folate-binding protein YgfZ